MGWESNTGSRANTNVWFLFVLELWGMYVGELNVIGHTRCFFYLFGLWGFLFFSGCCWLFQRVHRLTIFSGMVSPAITHLGLQGRLFERGSDEVMKRNPGARIKKSQARPLKTMEWPWWYVYIIIIFEGTPFFFKDLLAPKEVSSANTALKTSLSASRGLDPAGWHEDGRSLFDGALAKVRWIEFRWTWPEWDKS